MITEHVNRIPVHLDGKTIYDIVLEDSFDALAKEISALPVAGPASMAGSSWRKRSSPSSWKTRRLPSRA